MVQSTKRFRSWSWTQIRHHRRTTASHSCRRFRAIWTSLFLGFWGISMGSRIMGKFMGIQIHFWHVMNRMCTFLTVVWQRSNDSAWIPRYTNLGLHSYTTVYGRQALPFSVHSWVLCHLPHDFPLEIRNIAPHLCKGWVKLTCHPWNFVMHPQPCWLYATVADHNRVMI